MRAFRSRQHCVRLRPAAAGDGAGTKPAQPPAPPAAEAPQAESSTRAGQRLDKLFEKLKESESTDSSTHRCLDIERALERSGSATSDLLFTRAKEAMQARDFDLALDLLDYVTALRPQWAEPSIAGNDPFRS